MSPSTPDSQTTHEGWVKLRLVHARGRSILLPDHLCVDGRAPYWLQPQWVYAPLLNLDGPGQTSLHLAVANRWDKDVVLRIDFRGSDLVTELPDQSQVYRCTIQGPEHLDRYQAGRFRLRPDGGINLRLYHHTAKSTKPLILKSGYVRGSSWNFQGTKQLENCHYAYFTSLQRIDTEQDLQRIAMSGTGRIRLRLDQSPVRAVPDVVIDVYKERLSQRASRLGLWVPAEHVSPSHVYEHHTGVIEYEMAHPWIYRVGLVPGSNYTFIGDRPEVALAQLKRFEYLVIGDCTTTEGLIAPYDEEVTGETFEIQRLEGRTVFQFWRDHGNEALWTGDVEQTEFLP